MEQAAQESHPHAGGMLTGSWAFVAFEHPWEAAYADATVRWKEENWRALIRDMHRIGMDTVVWAHTAYWGRPLFPADQGRLGRRLSYLGCEDPLGVAADEADKLGMKVFYGVGLRGRADEVRDYAGLEKPWPEDWFRWHAKLAAALMERYGNRPSFGGLHISTEVGLLPGQVELYETLIRKHLRPVIGHAPILASPGNIGVEVADLSRLPADVARTGIDILAPRDYAGRSPTMEKAMEVVKRQARALERVRKPLADMGVKLWANCELFVLEAAPDGHDVWLPGPFERVRHQIELQAPLVEKLVCLQYPAIMNRRTDLVNIGPSSTEALYRQYLQYLKERFPARFNGLDG